MYQFTPGPWAVKSRKVFAKDEVGIAAVIAGHKGFSESSANLVLMAAAPDLLKAAINLLDAVVTQCDYGKGSATDQWVIEAKAAIEKATTNAYDRA